MRYPGEEGQDPEPSLLVGILLPSSDGHKRRHVTVLIHKTNINEHFLFAGTVPGAGNYTA